MRKILSIVLCVMLVAAVLTSCAPKAEAPAEDAAVTEEQADVPEEAADDAQEETTEEAEVAGDVRSLDDIKAAGKLVMLTEATFPPYEYLADGDNVDGADVEVATMVAEELGVELDVVNMDFGGLIMALQTGKGDLVAAGMSVTEERAKEVDFTVPYVQATQLIIVDKDDPQVSGPDDLEGKTLGVQLGTTGDLYVQDLIDEGADIDLNQYKSNMEAAMDLMSGRLDAIVLDELPAQSIADANDSLTTLDEPFTEEEYAMAVAKGNTELLDAINEVLQKLIDENKMGDMIQKHADNYVEING